MTLFHWHSQPAELLNVGSLSALTYADQIHEAIHPVADLEEDVPALPDGLWAESRPQQPGNAGHQEERAQEHRNDLHLLHQGDGDGLPLQHRERQHKNVQNKICYFINSNPQLTPRRAQPANPQQRGKLVFMFTGFNMISLLSIIIGYYQIIICQSINIVIDSYQSDVVITSNQE